MSSTHPASEALAEARHDSAQLDLGGSPGTGPTIAEHPSDRTEGAYPRPPTTLEQTGLRRDALSGLLIKSLHQRGGLSGFEVSDAMALPFGLVDDLLLELQSEGFLEVKEASGPARSAFRFALTGKGRARAADELTASRYVGPAPVPFGQYADWVRRQSVETVRIRREELEAGLSELVLPDGFMELLGPAVNSGKSLFLYGDPGNGKTRIAEAVAALFGETFFIPHAVDLAGQTMVLYDPVVHVPVESPAREANGADGLFRSLPEHDRRFQRVKRPVAAAAAELELSQLELRWDPFSRMYQAPLQLKANGGVLIIDDLGRQRAAPRELLNRWIVPLEQRVDYLTLGNGKKMAVPFDCLVVFSTNIEPRDLVEEAFLRRIHYKVRVLDPEPGQYDEIFSRCCGSHGIPYHAAAPELIRREYYETGRAVARGCHPRDILGHLRDIAVFRGLEPELSPSLLRQACESYFVAMDGDEDPGERHAMNGREP